MIRPGLVSVTFVGRSCSEVIELAKAAGLEAIEWHGRMHVPHGDLDSAERVGQATLDAGLQIAAYGSYFVLGASENEGLPFVTVLRTAKMLGAPVIRVWAGQASPEVAGAKTRTVVSDQARRTADQAAQEGITLVFEFHPDTLTETGESCRTLIETVDHPNVSTYWQPDPRLDKDQNLAQLRCTLPWLAGLHVFHWGPTDKDRHPLADGQSDWAAYLALARQCDRPLYTLLEFVKGGTIAQFQADAVTLHDLLGEEDA
ncbi:MAG: TIM barrel protein [Sedimentisphaerales bacterium]|nr:TIM barrel protein [Sedimentisphaerales bacterium]